MKKETFLLIAVFALVALGVFVFIKTSFENTSLENRKEVNQPPPSYEAGQLSQEGVIQPPSFKIKPLPPAISYSWSEHLLQQPDEAAPETIRVTITPSGITPKEFHVMQGEKVTFAVQEGDRCLFVMNDIIGHYNTLNPTHQEGIYALTFEAPYPGTYIFSCNVPGHALKGIEGTMIVESLDGEHYERY